MSYFFSLWRNDKLLIVDAYGALKKLLKNKFGEANDLTDAVEHLDKKSEAESRQNGVEEEVKNAKADEDADLLKAAQKIIDQLNAQPGGSEHVQLIATGSYIAQASHGGTASVNINQPDKE